MLTSRTTSSTAASSVKSAHHTHCLLPSLSKTATCRLCSAQPCLLVNWPAVAAVVEQHPHQVVCRCAVEARQADGHAEPSPATPQPTAAPAEAAAAAEAAAGGLATNPAQEAAAAQVAAAGWSFTTAEQKQLWDSVSRSLLKLGRAGVTESHARSLTELLASHTLVKVQLNGIKGDDAAAMAAMVADLDRQAGDAAVLLQVKGTTLLYGNHSSSQAELLAVAEAETASTAVWKAKRQIRRSEAAARRGAAAARGSQ